MHTFVRPINKADFWKRLILSDLAKGSTYSHKQLPPPPPQSLEIVIEFVERVAANSANSLEVLDDYLHTFRSISLLLIVGRILSYRKV